MKDHFKYLVHTLIGGEALATARGEGATRFHGALRQSQPARACAATDAAASQGRFIVDATSNTTNKTNTNSTDRTNTDTSNTTATNATTRRAQTDATTTTTAATDATTTATHTEATTAFEATTNRATTLADETTYRRTEVAPDADPTSIAIRLGRSPNQPESCACVG